MPDFMAQYLRALNEQRDTFLRLLDDAPHDEMESALCNAVAAEWHSTLPSADPDPRPAYAVDGSDAMRGFDNGTFLVVSHALLAGPDVEVADTSIVLQRDTVSSDSRERLRGLLTRAVEIGLALREVERCAGGSLYLDGSLFAQFGHLIYPYESAVHADIPLVVLERYLDLFEACSQHQVRIVALSKTTRGHLLAHALLDEARRPLMSRARRQDDVNLPNDGEVLARWARGQGQTTPILVGWEAFGDRAGQVVRGIEGLARSFVRAGVDGARARAALKRLQALPAVWASYVRLDDNDDCLRVECLSNEVTSDAPTLVDLRLKVTSLDYGRDIIAQVVADHTTPRLYNTGLYVADRMVRLSRITVDDKYLPLLRDALGIPLRLNRSERRFHSF